MSEWPRISVVVEILATAGSKGSTRSAKLEKVVAGGLAIVDGDKVVDKSTAKLIARKHDLINIFYLSLPI
jgi:hypothetical protein